MSSEIPQDVSPSEIARWLAAQPRRKKMITCAWCTKEVLGAGRREYCSRACQEKAWRARRKAQQEETRTT